jgi:hypothetical protein
MKSAKITMIAFAAIVLFACKKTPAPVSETKTASTTVEPTPGAALACQPGYYNLALDNIGQGYIYKISGSPSAGPYSISPVIGSAGNNIVGSSTVPTTVLKLTGLSYDPVSGVAYGITGNAGTHPNSIVKFAIGDPNVVSIAPLVSACGIALNLSDIERDPTTGRFYAINRSAAAFSNRVVVINLATLTVNCLANPINLGAEIMRGLTFDCNGRLYVLAASGNTGKLLDVNKVSGLITASFAYPGVITPGGVGAPEMGLHFDCNCIGRFITGSFVGAPLLTDGLPAGLGGPLYASLVGAIKPTVDFAKP